MTLEEMATFVCNKVGQADSTSKALCYGFVNARYKMIYDSYLWRDSQITDTATVTAATQTVPIPADMDRVVAIRAGGDNFLDPIDVNLLMQTDPTIFERDGAPTVYQEITDPADDARKIKVYPIPLADTALFIVGKRTAIELTAAAHTPLLRNIDNCLIAFAMGDMLERQRQYAKAQAKFTEAAAMLEAAKAVESAQTNQPRRAKQLTVSGNSLAELTDSVCARCGTWSLPDILLIKEFLRRNYQLVYDSYLWAESLVPVSVDSDGEQIVMPEYIDRIIGIRANADLGQIDHAEISLYLGITPQIFEQTGEALAFSYLTPVAVKVLPPQREKLSFVSTIDDDKNNVFVKGEKAGTEVSENVVLNGTTQVDTVNEYDVPLTVAKGITAGNVTVTGYTSTTVLQTLLATERERKHIRLWLQPHQTTAHECLVLGKRRIRPLVQDEDTPLLRDIQAVLIHSACADMYARMEKDKATADCRTQAAAALQTLIDLERSQGAFSARVIPYTEPMSGHYESSDWLVAK